MDSDAEKAGFALQVISGYRSYAFEVENEKTFIEAYGEAYAAKVDCHPGASEHQLGLLADFGTRDGYCRLDTCFSGTGASNWLQENAWKYGWIERHPAGKEAVTGTMYSPWNYRYVGKAFAKELYESGLTMEEYFNLIVQGFADMLPILMLLLIAFVLQSVTEGLGMTDYIIEVAQPFLTGAAFPAVVFVLLAAICFATGSLWGMSAVMAPIVFPLGAAIGANPLLIMAAVISGGAFGSHACFYTDATLLSSQSAGIDNMEHAVSQLPYVAIASVLSVIGFVVCGFAM